MSGIASPWHWAPSASCLLLLLLLLLGNGGVLAQTSNSDLAQSCGTANFQPTYTITNQTDADNISHCTTFNASITINPAAGLTNLTLNGIAHIGNSLTVQSSDSLTAFAAPDLQTITADMVIQNCSSLTSLSFPALQTTGTAAFADVPITTLPFVSNTTTGTTLESESSLFINTTQLNVFNTNMTTIDITMPARIGSVNFTSNSLLTTINVTGVTEVRGFIQVYWNDPSSNIWFNDVTIVDGPAFLGNMSQLNMPSLQRVDLLEVVGMTGTGFQMLQLVNAAGLVISQNPSMTAVSLPALKILGGLVVSQNPQLSGLELTGLTNLGGTFELPWSWGMAENPNLSLITWTQLVEVQGLVELFGNFTSIMTPNITVENSPGFIVNSTVSGFDCVIFDSMPFNGDSHAAGNQRYDCVSFPPGASADTAVHATSFPGSPSGSSGLSTGAKAGLGVGLGLGIPLLILAGIWIWRRGKKQREREYAERRLAGLTDDGTGGGHPLQDLGPSVGAAGAAGRGFTTHRPGERDELLDGLPGYRAAGEGPPGYHEHGQRFGYGVATEEKPEVGERSGAGEVERPRTP